MLRRLLLSLGVLQVALAFLASGHGHLDERSPILEDMGRPSSPGLEMVKEAHIPDQPSLLDCSCMIPGGKMGYKSNQQIKNFKQLKEIPRIQDDLEPETSMMMMSAALQAQEREGRSPRRCVRVQESCLGHKLPCCDPCATCYCRFFNANCFCKKFSSTFPCGRN